MQNAQLDLAPQGGSYAGTPLAERMRPRTLQELVGQDHLLAADKPLTQAIEAGRLHSMIFWGPPGCGKTTLARMLAGYADAEFVTLSAVTSGIKDIRAAIEGAKHSRITGRSTVLFVDEVHRFNKSQQDAFLPHIEDGTIVFIGATTENPSFELNNALLSRLQVYTLNPVSPDALQNLLQRAAEDAKRGLGLQSSDINEDAITAIAENSDGDARGALNLLETVADLWRTENKLGSVIDAEFVKKAAGARMQRFDKGGDAFYEQISALHKSVRGSNPDASLYWLARMLLGGCDPHYVLRRVTRIASEDIGNADPRALPLAIAAWEAFDRLGSPEGELAIAHAVAYLSCAPKSNAVYKAYGAASQGAQSTPSARVPLHLRNAPTSMMKNMGYGAQYQYDPDYEQGFASSQTHFPDEIGEQVYYQPVDQGLETRIAEKLEHWRSQRSAQ